MCASCVCVQVVCEQVVCEEATGAGAGGGRDAEPKTRAPHKDVGEKNDDNDDDNDEGGRTKTKEEGRRTKDERRRTRTNTQFLVTSCVCLPFLVSPLLFLEAWTIGCSKSLCVFV